jgi:2-aminomuconate deaminase
MTMADPREAYFLTDGARPLGAYPHARRAGDLLLVSGTSCRRPDNTHEGVTIHPDGRVEKDIRLQTEATIRNIGRILALAGLDLSHVVDVTTYLVSMDDFAGYNEVYNRFFEAGGGPARTTVAVAALPHPNLLIELKVVAAFPPGGP